uniref:Uncharacterized protein n=1 Tax=Dipterosiphonia australica TaxID=2007208 RepID=A0A1Z1ML27_9FLOR|nr:hypothetical protein [Dipterosiphonia australica]ARW66797.1 hypothetical protein [Dipterosiphonia australica]
MDDIYMKIRIFNNQIIEVDYFKSINYSHSIFNYPMCFIAEYSNINELFFLLSIFIGFQGLSSQHKMYLGKEILKAHISIKLKQMYIQS